MRNLKRILSFVCVLALLMGILAGCNDDQQGTNESSEPSASGTVDNQTKGYSVTVKSVGGLPLAGVTLLAYADESLKELRGYGQTDENGQAVLSLTDGGTYYLVLNNVPDGYLTDSYYSITSTATELVLTSQVIADPSLSGVSYSLGDVMHDFTVTDTEGNTHTLSELLEQKDMVMLNFWYTTCSWCVQEFPYMDTAYQNYSDDIEIIALNITDTASETKHFRDNFYDDYDSDENTTGCLHFPMALDEAGFATAFALEAAPTSVVIDRYGVICLIHPGALVDEDYFYYIFDAFIGDDYTQTLYESFDELMPTATPNVEMASSEEVAAVMNGGEINVTYAPETDPEAAEMSWPFIIGSKEGYDCLYASNINITGSYATMYAYVTLEEGQALALDYFASSESGADCLYVLIDRNDVYAISGESTKWNTCYPWVAPADGEYEVAFCYYKDSSDDVGDDTVYIKNLRVVDIADIDVPSYIPRFAATNLKADGFGYENYITPVYNEQDGYYHVNSANGPLLLANLMMPTQFSNTEIYTLAYNGQVVIDGVDYYEDLVSYFSYASNSQIYSLCPVNEELKNLLQKVAAAVGIEQTENEWLQICEYYDAYGTGGVQMTDPTAGLNAQSAYIAQLGTNYISYDRTIMPRGLLAKFVPTKSGVYRITSYSDTYVDGWVFTEESLESREAMYTYWFNERAWTDEMNVSMVLYLEAGKEYFIDIAYYDVYGTGTIEYTVEYEGSKLELLVLASPGFFTYYEGTNGDIIVGGIDVALGSDGYYHELLADGSLGSKLYVDMVSYSAIFNSQSILDLIASGVFNFAMDENDHWILDYYDMLAAQNFNGTDFETCMREIWGEDFEWKWEQMGVEDVLDGYYHGSGEDMTEVAQKYAQKIAKSGELEGCVAVNEELGQILQMLMDKFTFSGVENSWIKLCYYYDYIGPDPNK